MLKFHCYLLFLLKLINRHLLNALVSHEIEKSSNLVYFIGMEMISGEKLRGLWTCVINHSLGATASMIDWCLKPKWLGMASNFSPASLFSLHHRHLPMAISASTCRNLSSFHKCSGSGLKKIKSRIYCWLIKKTKNRQECKKIKKVNK